MANTTTAAAEESAKNRRQLKNFFQKPKFHLKFVNLFVLGGFTAMVGAVVLIQLRLLEIDSLLNSSTAMGVGGHLPVYDAFTDVATIALLALAGFVVYACVLALIISHRVAGPTIAIMACIDEIKKGNYDYKRQLRKGDELQPIIDGLHDLSRALKEQRRDSL